MTLSALLLSLLVQDGPLISSFDDIKIRDGDANAHSEVVEGKAGKAVKFSFAAGKSSFCMTPLRGAPEWDNAAGFSFWVKGDGSKNFGGLQLIWNEDYAARYDYMPCRRPPRSSST
jgi:hypothetical protein